MPPEAETPNSTTPPISTEPPVTPPLITGTDPATPPAEAQTPEQIAEAAAAAEAATAREAEMATPITAETLTLPEGFTTTDEIKTEFVDVVNKLGEMSPAERATALLDLQAKTMTAASEASSAQWNTMQDQWRAEVKADPTVGGDKLQPTLDSINRLVTEHGDPKLVEALAITGAGNHVEVVKFFAKLAGMLTEGSYSPGSPAGQEKTAAERLYPSMSK